MRYVAFLRGVSPTNASMPALKACFEGAGFGNVRTLLASGNVVFDARKAGNATLAARAEAAMAKDLERSFVTIVRSQAELQLLLARDAFARHGLPADAKAVLCFLRDPAQAAVPGLATEMDGARICERIGGEVYAYYTPSPKGPAFMHLLEKHFGKDITTRTLGTVRKCAVA